MPVPTHDLSCNSKAFKTNCTHCSAEVFYYSCSCGSKVFFNNLGYPWETHDCYEYGLVRELDLLQNIDRMSSDEIYEFIIKQEKRSGEKLNDRTMDIIEGVIGRRKSRLTIEIVEPQKELTEVSGIIMEINNPINIFKKLGYDVENEISRKLLGKIGDKNWMQLKIRGNPDRRNYCFEHIVFLRVDTLKTPSLKKNNFILGVAVPLVHAKGVIWELVKYEIY